MTLLTYNIDDKFICRVVKHLSTNPDNKWVNTYEFVATNSGVVGDFVTLGVALVEFEQGIHVEQVTFDRFTASTWEDDHVPYDPESFISVSLTAAGTRSDVPNEVEPLGMALRVNRQAVSGRFGNLFYRGALFENEVSSPAGIPVLSSPGTIQDNLTDVLASSGLGDYLLPGPGTPLQLAMINANGTQVRAVTGLLATGVSLIKQDHQWFNRTTPA